MGKDKIELYPIPELISYEAYQVQTKNINMNKLSLYFENEKGMNTLKKTNNEFYNFGCQFILIEIIMKKINQ